MTRFININWRNYANRLRHFLRRWLKSVSASSSRLPGDSSETDQNSGLCNWYGSAADLSQKTVIVLGLERGGTSMIAGALARLGVYMGDTLSAVHEDPEFAHCLRANNRKMASILISKRNAFHRLWGLKKTSPQLRKAIWINLFREPVFVVVFRDVMAIATRRANTTGIDLFDGMDEALRGYKDIIKCVQRRQRPTLMVSYEKALQSPELFARGLAEFIGVHDQEKIDDVIHFVEPSPQAYRNATRRHDHWRGLLERADKNSVHGWAFCVGSAKPVTVVLTLSDGRTLTTLADLSRLDVQSYHHHVSEFSGFEFLLPDEGGLVNEDVISVRIESESDDLNNSPMTFRSNS